MPIYEYECPSCGERFEVRRRIADQDNEIKCPKCGREAPKRVLSLFSATSTNGSCAPHYDKGAT